MRGRKKDAVAATRFSNPETGTRVGSGTDLYHDASSGEFACTVRDDGSIVLTIYQFDGSYLSVVKALPRSQLSRCRPGRKLQLSFDASSTRPLTVFCRMNAATSEATETRHEMLVIHKGGRSAEFDLAGLGLDLHELQSVWLDVIFSEPQMTEVVLKNINLEAVSR